MHLGTLPSWHPGTLVRDVRTRRYAAVGQVFVAHDGHQPELHEHAERVDAHVRAAGPVAEVFSEGFFAAVWRMKPGPEGDERHGADSWGSPSSIRLLAPGG